MSGSTPTAQAGHDEVSLPPRGPLPLVAVAAVGLVAGLLTLLALSLGDNEDFSGQRATGGTKAASAVTPPRPATVAELTALARSSPRAIYWAGPQSGFVYELTRAPGSRIFIRYLPPGVKVGNRQPTYRFVATYPDPAAFATVKRASRLSGTVTRKVPGGGIAVASKRGDEIVRATAVELPSPPVFFAEPGSDVLVEVFDPSLSRALRLVAAGNVRRIR